MKVVLWTLPNGWPGRAQGVIMRSPERTSHEEARVAETLKKGSRVTGAARDKLAADLKKKYDSGASIRALAEETGRSYGFVHRMLSESGVTLRGRGGATRGKKAASA
ncbi:Transcriptional regulator [Streptomyces clavuligerus]|uniref:Transcriptional regulator n=14 Tax=Streptomyces TaxID=1883 RepID=E2PXL1_STRCL|nr:Transcriptional regulator [Streptomyces clavuligerus]